MDTLKPIYNCIILFSVIISYIDDINGYNKESMHKCIKYLIFRENVETAPIIIYSTYPPI